MSLTCRQADCVVGAVNERRASCEDNAFTRSARFNVRNES